MPEVRVRVHVMLKPDGTTSQWTYYSKVMILDVVPVPGDVIMIAGPNPPELHSAGPGSTNWVPSGQGLLASVTIDKRFFTPEGHVVLDALPPAHLHRRNEDDDSTSDQELWDRLNWGALLQTLDQAGYQRQDSAPAPGD